MIKFLKVTKRFGEDKPALYNISFEVEAGELVVITGPSGSGKTTLLKLLTREYVPTQGEIYFQNENINLLKDSQIAIHRRKIGAVFQDYKLLAELNVWENLALTLSIIHLSDDEIAEKVTDLLKLVGLEDKAYLFPHQLSGGEAQRISIARALSTAPSLIFADEPTGNLDAVTSLTIAKLLKKINQLGTTVLVTTHDPVVIAELSGARRLDLEKGELKRDSGTKNKKSASQVEGKKKEKKSVPDAENRDQPENEKSKNDDLKSIKEAKKNKKQKIVQKLERKFNFFGLFGKKKAVESSDSKEKVNGEKNPDVIKTALKSKNKKNKLTKNL